MKDCTKCKQSKPESEFHAWFTAVCMSCFKAFSAKGGSAKHPNKGFAANPKRAAIAGAKGGRARRRSAR